MWYLKLEGKTTCFSCFSFILYFYAKTRYLVASISSYVFHCRNKSELAAAVMEWTLCLLALSSLHGVVVAHRVIVPNEEEGTTLSER